MKGGASLPERYIPWHITRPLSIGGRICDGVARYWSRSSLCRSPRRISPTATAADRDDLRRRKPQRSAGRASQTIRDLARGSKVVVSYGASNALAKQIEAGAPADIFISADVDWMDYIDQRRLLAPNTRFDLLRNTLVLIAPRRRATSTLKIAPEFSARRRAGPGKLAMANPDSVPAGKYGKSALGGLGSGQASRSRSRAARHRSRGARAGVQGRSTLRHRVQD